jgi:hypothetical protein
MVAIGPWRKSVGSHIRSRYFGPGAARAARKALSVCIRGPVVAEAGSFTETSCAPGSISGRARAASRVEMAARRFCAAARAAVESARRLDVACDVACAVALPGLTTIAIAARTNVNTTAFNIAEIREIRIGAFG